MALKYCEAKPSCRRSTESTNHNEVRGSSWPPSLYRKYLMAQIGSDNKPFVVKTGTLVSKESRFRQGFNKAKYDENYDRIFRKNEENNMPKRFIPKLKGH